MISGFRGTPETQHIYTCLNFFNENCVVRKDRCCLHGAGLWLWGLYGKQEAEPGSSFLSCSSELEDDDRLESAMVLAVPSVQSQHLESHKESLPGRHSGDKKMAKLAVTAALCGI